jgi:hypothetical protein
MTGFTSSTSLVLTYIAYDIRDGRAFWKRHRPDAYECKRTKQLTYFNAMATVIIFIGAVLISIALGYAVGSGKDNAADPLYVANSVQFPNGTYGKNTLCSTTIGDRFSFIDFTTMSGAAYSPNVSIATSFSRSNPNLQDIRVHQENFEDNSGNHIIEFRFDASPNVSVISVRGTATVEDVVNDILLWSTPAILQGSSYFGTFMSLWPQKVAAKLVAAVSRYVAFSNFLIFRPTELLVQDLLLQNRTVYITGHSLGGGIASIVGSRLGIQAISVSAPGLGLSIESFGLSLERITQWTTNVVPFNDPGTTCYPLLPGPYWNLYFFGWFIIFQQFCSTYGRYTSWNGSPRSVFSLCSRRLSLLEEHITDTYTNMPCLDI